jgi:glycosyltransferase involved in cell wall biosynthesis
MSSFRIAVLIPTNNNPLTLRSVVEDVRKHVKDVLVVDDGSAEPGRELCVALAREGLVSVVHHEKSAGKGAAVKTGLKQLQALGFSHAFQVDADGQHAIADMPRFLAAAEAHPDALVLGSPEFDQPAPRVRSLGRSITRFWTHVETLGPLIEDATCGFRVYPIAPALRAEARGNAMDFDPEIAVRIAWDGTPVLNLLTRVRYVGKGDGGGSHFRLVRDNALISWMHTRLMLSLFGRLMLRRVFVKRSAS